MGMKRRKKKKREGGKEMDRSRRKKKCLEGRVRESKREREGENGREG